MTIFDDVRERVTLLDAIQYLGLQVKQEGPGQYRTTCPACRNSGKRDLSINATKGFQCFRGSKKGNDATALVAHCRGITQTEAATELASHFLGTSTKPQPQQEKQEVSEADPLEILGISPELAADIGVQTEVGRVGFPIRHAAGDQAGMLWLATSADLPLVEWEAVAPAEAKPGPQDLKSLWRVVRGRAS